MDPGEGGERPTDRHRTAGLEAGVKSPLVRRDRSSMVTPTCSPVDRTVPLPLCCSSVMTFTIVASLEQIEERVHVPE
jgi:hypothetical protein